MNEKIGLYDKIKCKTCRKEIERIDMFSSGECITCYEKTADINYKASIEELKNMFVDTINK